MISVFHPQGGSRCDHLFRPLEFDEISGIGDAATGERELQSGEAERGLFGGEIDGAEAQHARRSTCGLVKQTGVNPLVRLHFGRGLALSPDNYSFNHASRSALYAG